MRDPRYDVLFEPVTIGPVTAKNRFYQVPHCNGMGHANPHGVARMRGVKAEGGWAVVSTEEVEIHPSGDITPYVEGRLWDDKDIPGHALMTDAVHAHGALAAIELTHNGLTANNFYSREVAMAPGHQVNMFSQAPTQARAMDKSDIRAYRRWHRAAALRSRQAGFDIIYVYAGHELSLAMQFLQKRRNDRTDEYGGSLENRTRLLRELLEDTRDAVGDTCGVALRIAVDELLGEQGICAGAEGRDIVESIAELPDLFDVNVSSWANDSTTSRFTAEGSQEAFVSFVKRITSKPVVGVGRFTSPDTMVSQIRRGVLDFIGAARPSIADPFLPQKIERGDIDDIRECIGCNICVSGDFTSSPIRCTQNPTMGEEWRKGWHPERVPAAARSQRVLVVGGGPAGLECARTLANRGCEAHLSEASGSLGGRVSLEAKLPGLAAWARVRDYRVGQIQKAPNVHVYLGSPLSADDILEFGADRVVLATGSRWRRDGVGRRNTSPIPGFDLASVYTPDDIMSGQIPSGPIVVFDDDHYYMGGVLAEALKKGGGDVTIVTPATQVSSWSENTLEQHAVQRRLLEIGVNVVTARNVCSFDGQVAALSCIYTQRHSTIAAASIVTVTARLPRRDLYDALVTLASSADPALIAPVLIGDALAPGTIAAAVYGGHRYGREFELPLSDEVPFKREHFQYL